ncbi:unnamed protein product [Phyllotreta striolata]|uniref:Uncharacterized protein n=1 Tax=Phyllotreta striolata TaxID=444603 RepID=A0A9N9TS38_PHYSR|nr:unnamed protein product [Phyllotreta striolata]
MNNFSFLLGFLCICVAKTMQELNVEENDPCRRPCERGFEPLVCHYKFEIEWYSTLAEACRNCPFNVTDCFRPGCIPGDGNRRKIVTINKMLPGPSIEVCQNDTVVVDVINKLENEATTIHWHGQLQRAYPYMDGVPYVTQCPIEPYTSFRYTFKATQAGTHFWHSHMGMQRVDGAFGPLIVRVPKEKDYHSDLYDFDLSSHTLIISDWETKIGEIVLLSHFYSQEETSPASLLVNGIGRHKTFYNGRNKTFVPTARFDVQKGFRYRFRVINSGSLNCPVELTVVKHDIIIISTDGQDIKPIKASSLIMYAGERYDFILHANQKRDLYWIKFRGLLNCNTIYTSVFQVAVLEYAGINAEPNSYPSKVFFGFPPRNGIQVNPLNEGNESNNTVVPVSRMEAIDDWNESLQLIPDFQYYIGFDFNNISLRKFQWPHKSNFKVKNPVKIPQFNHISFLNPSIPLLPQRDQLDGEIFCNDENHQEQNCSNVQCQCVHGIKIPLGAVVELIFVDEGYTYDGGHPIHLHGYAFRVISMERLGSSVSVEQVKKRDEQGLIYRNLYNAPLKDTVSVPDGGYTIVRFVANNPGYWVLHCHIEIHLALGMTMILQVGEKKEMVPVPRDFPRCYQSEPEFTVNLDSYNASENSGSWVTIQTKFVIVMLLLVLYVIF